jgi:hypothetical protein
MPDTEPNFVPTITEQYQEREGEDEVTVGSYSGTERYGLEWAFGNRGGAGVGVGVGTTVRGDQDDRTNPDLPRIRDDHGARRTVGYVGTIPCALLRVQRLRSSKYLVLSSLPT